jgi:hypothetical protein
MGGKDGARIYSKGRLFFNLLKAFQQWDKLKRMKLEAFN